MRPGNLRTSHEQRRRSSLALPPEHLTHLNKVADAASMRRRGSFNLEPIKCSQFDQSPARSSSTTNLNNEFLFKRKQSESKQQHPIDTELELRTSNLVWTGVIVSIIIVAVIVFSILTRKYFMQE